MPFVVVLRFGSPEWNPPPRHGVLSTMDMHRSSVTLRHLFVPCLAATAQSFAFTSHAPLVPLMIAQAGLSPTEAGLLTTAVFAANGALSLPLGGLTDRLGAKQVPRRRSTS